MGTYGVYIASKPFQLTDVGILAFVVAHGWAAEDLIWRVVERLRMRRRSR